MERFKAKVKKENLNNQKLSPRLAMAWFMIVSGMIIVLLSFVY
jgi:hypothetical protein